MNNFKILRCFFLFQIWERFLSGCEFLELFGKPIWEQRTLIGQAFSFLFDS